MSQEDERWIDIEEKEFKHTRAAYRLRGEKLKLTLDDADERNLSYEPGFSGGRPQLIEEFKKIHWRWVDSLRQTWPIGVPSTGEQGEEPWPDSFEKHPGGGDRCAQCGSCQYYIPLEGDLGGDWGACTNPSSQYDRTCTFEHWTCKEFTS